MPSSQKIIVIGAGSQGVTVADILQRGREAGAPAVPIGFVDDTPELLGTTILGLPVLGHVPGFAGDQVGSLAARGYKRARVPLFLRWRSHR